MMGLRRKKRNRWQSLDVGEAFAQGLASPVLTPAVVDSLDSMESQRFGSWDGRKLFVVDVAKFFEFQDGEWKECDDSAE